MRPAELRRLSDEELQSELAKARDELFNTRFQLATRQLKDHSSLRRTRRKLAQLLTIERERELERELQAGSEQSVG